MYTGMHKQDIASSVALLERETYICTVEPLINGLQAADKSYAPTDFTIYVGHWNIRKTSTFLLWTPDSPQPRIGVHGTEREWRVSEETSNKLNQEDLLSLLR